MENFRLNSIKTKTLKDVIYNKIKNNILNKQFPSEYYITEQTLANQLEVSRTPLREAMMELVNEELIEFKPRKGYKIRTYSTSEISQIFLLRTVIECEIIKPLLQNLNLEKIDILKEIINKQKKCMEFDDGETFIYLDKEFHREMFLISGYNIFLKSYDVFHNLTILIGSQAIKKKGRMEEVIQEHERIIFALEKKNVNNVKSAITYHLNKTENMYTNVTENDKL